MSTAKPKYEQLRRALLDEIRNGARADEALASERELMARFNVSRATVRQAIELLAAEGWVYTVQGAGTFVAGPSRIRKSLRLTSFSEDMAARRLVPGSKLLLAVEEPADVDVARDLVLSPGAAVHHLRRLRLADGTPMCLEDVHIPVAVAPGLLDRFTEGSLYQYLENTYAIVPVRADQTMRATVVGAAEAQLLDVPPHSPAMQVSRVAYDARDRPVERAVTLYRADRYDFRVTVSRRRPT